MLQGCKYNGKEIESGQLELFPEECGFCSCSPEGDLMCCRYVLSSGIVLQRKGSNH